MNGTAMWAEPHEDRTDAIFALLQRPEWHAEAACRGEGMLDVMFPKTRAAGAAWATARAVCMSCPVRRECCAEADARGEAYGMWGGKRRGPSTREVDFDALLAERDDWTVSELAKASNLHHRTVRRVLNEAVNAGLAVERVDPTNRSRRLYGAPQERRSA